MKQILAAFRSHDRADEAIDQLRDAGFSTQDISIIVKHAGFHGTRERTQKKDGTTGSQVAQGAGSGLVAGGVLGGLAGLLAGAVGVIIVGPIAAAIGLSGIIGTTITGLVLGASAGGLIGALSKIGVSEGTARNYEETIKSGGVVIGIPYKSDNREEILDILEDNGATDLTEIEVP